MFRLLGLLIFGFIIVLKAEVIITDDIQRVENFELEYYYDSDKNQTIESIQSVEFKQKTSNVFTFGFISGNSWFRLRVTNKSQTDRFVFQLIEPFFQRIYFYELNDDTYKRQKAGLKFYQKDKNPKYLTPIFDFDIEPNATKTIYIQFAPDAKTAGSSFGRFTLSTQSGFNSRSLLGYYLFYFFFLGTMSIIVIFYMFLYIKFRDIVYLYYGLYIVFLSIYVTIYSGLIHHFGLALWYRELSLAMPLFVIFLILFSIHFLKLKIYLPKIYKLLKLIAFIFFISLPYMLYDYSHWIATVGVSTIFIAPISALSAIYVVYKGHSEAKFYLVGILFYIGALTVLPLMSKGVIPHTTFTHYAFSIFSYIEIIFFSLVLVKRFYATQNDKIRLQSELLKIQKNNEKILENRVKKRTNKVNQLLAEKEVLLKEVYHRVKNNFHMAISLLWIEYENQKDEEQKSTLLELMNRIKSMALINQYLLGMNAYSQINASEYLTRIIQEIEKSYSDKLLYIEYEIDEFILSPDDALSLGIIINELLTNAIKHHQDNSCHIQIECFIKDNEVILMIEDNGDGFDIEESSDSFGLELIDEFSNKLNASKQTFSFESGTRFELCFALLKN